MGEGAIGNNGELKPDVIGYDDEMDDVGLPKAAVGAVCARAGIGMLSLLELELASSRGLGSGVASKNVKEGVGRACKCLTALERSSS